MRRLMFLLKNCTFHTIYKIRRKKKGNSIIKLSVTSNERKVNKHVKKYI